MLNKKFILPVIYGLSLLFTLYIVIQYIVFKPEQAGIVSGKLSDPFFPYQVWKLFFFPHIALGVIALLIGAFQLTNQSRRNPKWHKRAGRIYGAAILLNVLLVPYMALYATGGMNSTIAFLVLDFFWLITTLMGIWLILKKNISQHREWIVRSYAITFVFVTFRIALLIEQLILDAPMSVTFPIAVYASILFNLIITEMYIRHRRVKNSTKHVKGAF